MVRASRSTTTPRFVGVGSPRSNLSNSLYRHWQTRKCARKKSFTKLNDRLWLHLYVYLSWMYISILPPICIHLSLYASCCFSCKILSPKQATCLFSSLLLVNKANSSVSQCKILFLLPRCSVPSSPSACLSCSRSSSPSTSSGAKPGPHKCRVLDFE
jgi:hypothetical protein